MTKQYDDEFKASAVKKFLEAKHAGVKITDVATELGVSDSLLYAWTAKAKKQSKGDHRRRQRASYPIELKQQAAELVASGMTYAEAGRKLKVDPARVTKWAHGFKRGVKGENLASKRLPAPLPEVIPKPINGLGGGGELTDALIYLRHAEREIMQMVREGKISRPDPAHLLTLLALACLQKGVNR